MKLLQRVALFSGGMYGAVGVALSALASHVSSEILAANGRDMLRAASQMELLHAVLIITLALSQKPNFIVVTLGFIVGILFFCVPVTLAAFGWIERAYGAPAGGMLLIVSWLYLALAAIGGRATKRQRSIED